MTTTQLPGPAPTTLSSPPAPTLTTTLLIVIAALSALTPIAMDLYLPAFPRIAADLGTDATGVQLTLTVFLIGTAIGQLVFGPWSDRVGRRLPLIIGASLSVAAGALTALAPNLPVLIAGRAVQGFTLAAGMVLSRAIITDLVKGRQAARAFSLTLLVLAIAPVIAPLAGAILVGPVGWRGLLWVVTAISALLLVVVTVGVRESHHPAAHRDTHRSGGTGWAGFTSKAFVANTITLVFSFAAMMGYIAASPFVYQDILGLDELTYGLLFAGNAILMMVVSGVGARLTHHHEPRRLLTIGVTTLLLAAVALTVIIGFSAPPWLIPIPLALTLASLGLIVGNATALALGAVAGSAGTASAVLGCVQFLIGGAASALVGLGGGHSATPLALVLLGCGVIACAGNWIANRPSTTSSHPTTN